MIRLKTLLEQSNNLKPVFTVTDENLINIGAPIPSNEPIYTYKLQAMTPERKYVDIASIRKVDDVNKSIVIIHLDPNKPETIKFSTNSWNSILNNYNKREVGQSIDLFEFMSNRDNNEIDRSTFDKRVYYKLTRVK